MEASGSSRPLDPRLSHLSGTPEAAQAHMVDVGQKSPSERHALARARIAFPPGVRDVLLAGKGPKGAITEVARTAGILAAKRTAELIPLCHPLGLDLVEIRFEPSGADALDVYCRASCRASTGVEMESLVGATLAALTVYDMGKGLDKGIRIESVELLEKSGGKSGPWRAPSWSGSILENRARA
jgi:cyclic pyranopterin phosphate synthase